MSFDAIAIAAIADELRQTVVGGRVQKGVQAEEHPSGLQLYARPQGLWLLLSADPQRARVPLAGDKVGRSAEVVSPLLLLLRKHLRSARLLAVTQPDFERVLALAFSQHSAPGSSPGTPDEEGVEEQEAPAAG